jgi:hypothetical protein
MLLIVLSFSTLQAQPLNFIQRTDFVQKVPIPAFARGDIESADLNGDLDIIVSGDETGVRFVTKVYLNNGLGQFTESNALGFYPLLATSIVLVDLDNDGDEDLVMSGEAMGGDEMTLIYENRTDSTLSLKQPIRQEKLAEMPPLFPNPNQGNFVLPLLESATTVVRIYDLKGHLVYEKSFVAKQSVILDLKLSPAIYVLQRSVNGQSETQKLVISQK